MKKRKYYGFLIFCILFCLPSTFLYSQEEKRFALLIGNSEYQYTKALANPVNDATDMAQLLKSVGFHVKLELNATNAQMHKAVRDFFELLTSQKADVALFYYAGHGMEHEGVNYLIPINADIKNSYELLDKALSMDRVIEGLRRAGTKFNLVLLDACRDNPFLGNTRSSSRGLAVISSGGSGNMFVFATEPGSVAQDGEGRNSPFTKALLDHIQTPDLEIRHLITEVQRSVERQTNGRQRPWMNTSFTGEFYFIRAEQQLAKIKKQEEELNKELRILEQEILKRTEEIQKAKTLEERRRLEAEQIRAKAQESARLLEAERLTELRKKTEQILLERSAQEVLKREMEKQLSEQQASLSRRAAERRAELERLRKQSQQKDYFEMMRTIATIKGSLLDIASRFDQLKKKSLADLEEIHRKQIEQYIKENPRDPWETKSEYENRINYEIAKLKQVQEKEKSEQERRIENQHIAETQELNIKLNEVKEELRKTRITLGIESTQVTVEEFNPNEKLFPVNVFVNDPRFAFKISTSYKIQSRDRDVLRREYYRVYSASQSGGFTANVELGCYEIAPDVWAIRPIQTRVINLLENDTVLISTADGMGLPSSSYYTVSAGGNEKLYYIKPGKVNEFSSWVWISSDTTEEIKITRNDAPFGKSNYVYYLDKEYLGPGWFKFEWNTKETITYLEIQKGINSPIFLSKAQGVQRIPLLIFVGLPPESNIQIGGTTYASRDNTAMIPIAVDNYPLIMVSSPWLIQDIRISFSSPIRNDSVVWIDLSSSTPLFAGRLNVEKNAITVVEVYDTYNRLVSEIEEEKPFKPGIYQIAFRKKYDPYISEIEKVIIEPFKRTWIRKPNIEYSARFQLEQAQMKLGTVNEKIQKSNYQNIFGWSMLALAAAGIYGSIYSYNRIQEATDAYHRADITETALHYRSEVKQNAGLFSISIGFGTGGAILGGYLLLTNSNRSALIQEQRELENKIKLLKETVDRQISQNSLFAAAAKYW